MNSLGIDKPAHETRVAVAMSGGVDSSAVAALLADEGYDVIGVTMQLYKDAAQAARPDIPCAGRDVADARQVAETIGIPHHAFDFQATFQNIVVDAFAETYLAGETPVPCARCNQKVKFGHLMGAAKELGADLLATGHYAVWRHGPGGAELHRGADRTRDQSYFLFTASRAQLDGLRFPLGAMDKEQTRNLARRFGPADGRTRGQPGHLLHPRRRLRRLRHPVAARSRRTGRHRRSGRQRTGPPRGHHPLHGRPAAGPWASAVRAGRSTSCGWNPSKSASSSAPSRPCAAPR